MVDGQTFMTKKPWIGLHLKNSLYCVDWLHTKHNTTVITTVNTKILLVLVRLSNTTSFYQRQSQSMYSTVNSLTDLMKLKDDLKLKNNFALLVQKYFMLATCNFKKSVSLFLCFYLMLMKTRNLLCCRLLHKRSFSDHQKVVH